MCAVYPDQPPPPSAGRPNWLAALAARFELLWQGGRDAPPPLLRRSVGRGDFHAVGAEFLTHFRDLAGLRPDERVLDVGCGVGRIALPLTRYLEPPGSYDGIDIVPRAIRWCRRHITAKHPAFRFHLAPVYNSVYNPRGKLPAERYEFPFPDGSFDFAILTSVFTHMRGPDAKHYLSELFRVLRPGGRLFSTWFLLNEESEELTRQRGTARPFLIDHGEYRTVSDEHPETAVGYPEPSMRNLVERYGFHIQEPVRYGKWCGRSEGASFQDIVLANRPAG